MKRRLLCTNTEKAFNIVVRSTSIHQGLACCHWISDKFDCSLTGAPKLPAVLLRTPERRKEKDTVIRSPLPGYGCLTTECIVDCTTYIVHKEAEPQERCIIDTCMQLAVVKHLVTPDDICRIVILPTAWLSAF